MAPPSPRLTGWYFVAQALPGVLLVAFAAAILGGWFTLDVIAALIVGWLGLTVVCVTGHTRALRRPEQHPASFTDEEGRRW